METILKTVDLVKYYGDGESEVRAIDHTSIEVENGEFVAIVGRSGSGKSTAGQRGSDDWGKEYLFLKG